MPRSNKRQQRKQLSKKQQKKQYRKKRNTRKNLRKSQKKRQRRSRRRRRTMRGGNTNPITREGPLTPGKQSNQALLGTSSSTGIVSRLTGFFNKGNSKPAPAPAPATPAPALAPATPAPANQSMFQTALDFFKKKTKKTPQQPEAQQQVK